MIINSVDFFTKEPITFPTDCELIIAAWKIKNPENLGHIIRMGHNVGAKQILFIGEVKERRESKIKKTAGFSYEQQNWMVVDEETFFSTIAKDFELAILETCEGSTNIFNTELPKKTILLGGNESHGLPENIISKSDLKVHIPMPGGCKSMNISHALSTAAFEWFRQMAF